MRRRSGSPGQASAIASSNGACSSPVRRPMGAGTRALTPEQTKAAESKLGKLKTRLLFGTPMIIGFFVLVWLGHPYMVVLVCLLQTGLFRELVNVRYKPAKERKVPLFRTIQWAMFAVAMVYAYGSVFVRLGLAHSAAERMPHPMLGRVVLHGIKYHRMLSFAAYVATFICFVLSLRPGLYKYQIGNIVWTIGVLGLVVWQIGGTTELIFAGLVWFMLPCGLVVANDCFAYFCGVSMGRRFTKLPFLKISPNKTWEGFIGGFFCTLAFAWFYADLISRSKWLICRQDRMDPFASLSCAPPDVFQRHRFLLPSADIHMVTITAKPFQLHALLLAMFASVVAPFGGFLASGIKRAYNIKDFDSVIPGHGGFMDRMDCQFLMLLCTNVWYRTFVQEQDMSEDALVTVISAMAPAARANFLQRLLVEFNCSGTCPI